MSLSVQNVLDLAFNQNIPKGEVPIKYIRPFITCTKNRNHFTNDFDLCTPPCKAFAWCHYSLKSGCETDREEIYNNMEKFTTTNRLCIECLSMKICCLPFNHSPNIYVSDEQVSPDNFLYLLINYLIHNQIEKKKEENPDIETWKIPDNLSTQWIGGRKTKVFLNRKAYDNCVNTIFESKKTKNANFLLIGTPGIGKTAFINRVFYEIIQRWRTGGKKMKIFYKFRQGKYEKEAYIIHLFSPSATPSFIITRYYYDGIPDDITYHISDNVDLSLPKAKVFTLLVASDKQDNYNQFYKKIMVDNNTKSLITMPLFGEEELYAISPDDWPLEMKKFRYSVTGGIPRSFSSIYIKNRPLSTLVVQALLKYYQNDSFSSKIEFDKGEPFIFPGEFKPDSFQFHFYSMVNLLKDAGDSKHKSSREIVPTKNLTTLKFFENLNLKQYIASKYTIDDISNAGNEQTHNKRNSSEAHNEEQDNEKIKN